jgi:dolichyl-phosphate beta-glucosyltransferase
MRDAVFLSVVIPTYNEARRIVGTLQKVSGYLSSKDYTYEIIVVNDGSTDNTRDVVSKLAQSLPSVRIISYEENKGKGHAVKTGMREARGQYNLFMDADGSVDISHVQKFIENADSGFDVVIGSIRLPGAIVQDENGLARRMLSWISRSIILIFTSLGVSDTQRGFKLFSRKASANLFKKQTISRFTFDVELLVAAKEQGLKIKELPVTWRNSAGSKVKLHMYFQSFVELLSITQKKLSGHYQLKSAVDDTVVKNQDYKPRYYRS